MKNFSMGVQHCYDLLQQVIDLENIVAPLKVKWYGLTLEISFTENSKVVLPLDSQMTVPMFRRGFKSAMIKTFGSRFQKEGNCLIWNISS